MSTHIYEINDVSDEESYYPVGIFLTLEDAIRAIEETTEPWSLCEYASDFDFAKLEILKRAIGLTGAGVSVWERSWNREYRGDTDEFEWRQCK